ncbi:MAG: restriction endonuclease subunit R [Verrucomicrobiae bacterium]|nr:restriction endonuclease subunit R [Verrucomicrobiae bacterium]
MEDNLQKKLLGAVAECSRLQVENLRLRKLLSAQRSEDDKVFNTPAEDQPSFEVAPVTPCYTEPLSAQSPGNDSSSRSMAEQEAVTHRSPPEAKVKLFRSLFRGREDVYAVRWEGRNGKVGYSPACVRDWRSYSAARSKSEAKKNRKFLPLTDQVIHDHLSGKLTAGVYPLLPDETCWFLAVDFDKATWQEDTAQFMGTCAELNVPAALERSRSGRGGHVWIFFETAIPASLARKLGAALLTRTMERRHQIGLDSYDRLFPNQDTMPKGGFGNLIALPLQHVPRKMGNSVFLTTNFMPYSDQWAFLSSVKRMHQEAVANIVREAERAGKIIGVRLSFTDEDDGDDPWTLPPSRKKKEPAIKEPLPSSIRIVRSNLVYVEKEGLPSSILNRLMRLAAFQNPEFYKAQAMRLSTFGKPRVIRCAQEFSRHVGLPRGCLDETLELFKAHRVNMEFSDERYGGKPIHVEFHGTLRPEQQKAAEALAAQDTGVLSATTAFGKTVVAAWMIGQRKVNSLILVHRRQLLDQWRERLAVFLDLPLKSIGQFGGGKKHLTGDIDVAIIQSLNRKGMVNDLVAEYGQVIVDECHHISAFSFEQVLRQAKARYVLGLTATPLRKDGHHPIILMQCGPIRYRVNPREQATKRPFKHVVISRITNFHMPMVTEKPEIHEVYRRLASDKARNDLIFENLLAALKAWRSPLLLSERTAHVKEFAERLKDGRRHVITLTGGMNPKQRRELAEQLRSIPDKEERVLVATGSYIGEGFDDARLDTLFLAMPISWHGTLHQYVGRLHRLHDNKREVQVYDYVDAHVPVLARMFEKRCKGYEAIGYEIRKDWETDETIDFHLRSS